MLVGHPAVLEAAAIGVPDDVKGESLWVFVVVRPGVDAERRVARGAAGARRRAPRSVVPAVGRALHRRAAEDAQRQGAAPRDSRGRDRNSARGSLRPRGSGRSRCDRGGALTMVELVGSRVVLRPLRADDWEAWREVRHRGARVARTVGAACPSRGAPTRRPSARRSAPAAARGNGSATSTPPTGSACSSPTAAFAGEVSLGSVQRGPFQMAYIGYWIDEALAGRGYVPEAVVLIMRYAFETLSLHRLEAAIVPAQHAEPARREKLGLREEGIAIGFLQIQGVFEDHVRYAMTVEEWKARGPELVAVPRTSHSDASSSAVGHLRWQVPLGGTSPDRVTRSGARPRWRSRRRSRLPRHLAQRLLGRAPTAASARRAARAASARVPRRAARRRGGSSTRGRSRRRVRRRSRSPNSTIAAAACGPTARSSIQVCPPPGCRPICRKRASKRPMSPASRTSHASARFMPGADGGTVDRGDRRQRRAQHAEEPLVDRHDAAALASSASGRASAPRLDDVGAAAERGRLAGDDDRADARRRLEPRRTSRRSRRPSARSSRCAVRGRRA